MAFIHGDFYRERPNDYNCPLYAFNFSSAEERPAPFQTPPPFVRQSSSELLTARAAKRSATSSPSPDPTKSRGPEGKSAFLTLPFELRCHIYGFLLPSTTVCGRGVAWLRGHTAILATNSQIYKEASDMMYGHATFLLDVKWDGIRFKCQWLLPSGLVPNRNLAFPDSIALRNLAYIRRYHVRIHYVDSYTGMVKYNYGGRGLTEGLKDQVERLAEVLKLSEFLHRVEVQLVNGAGQDGLTQVVLGPLGRLKGVQNVAISGVGSTEVALSLKRQMETPVLGVDSSKPYHQTVQELIVRDRSRDA